MSFTKLANQLLGAAAKEYDNRKDSAVRATPVLFGTMGSAVSSASMADLFLNKKFRKPAAIAGGVLGYLGSTHMHNAKFNDPYYFYKNKLKEAKEHRANFLQQQNQLKQGV